MNFFSFPSSLHEFFSWHFPLHEFFLASPPPPPPHHFSNGPSLTCLLKKQKQNKLLIISYVNFHLTSVQTPFCFYYHFNSVVIKLKKSQMCFIVGISTRHRVRCLVLFLVLSDKVPFGFHARPL